MVLSLARWLGGPLPRPNSPRVRRTSTDSASDIPRRRGPKFGGEITIQRTMNVARKVPVELLGDESLKHSWYEPLDISPTMSDAVVAHRHPGA